MGTDACRWYPCCVPILMVGPQDPPQPLSWSLCPGMGSVPILSIRTSSAVAPSPHFQANSLVSCISYLPPLLVCLAVSTRSLMPGASQSVCAAFLPCGPGFSRCLLPAPVCECWPTHTAPVPRTPSWGSPVHTGADLPLSLLLLCWRAEARTPSLGFPAVT